MRLASILCASFIAVSALSADAATLGSFKIGTAPGTTEADCTKAGGTVSVDANGIKICTLPKSGPTQQREPTN